MKRKPSVKDRIVIFLLISYTIYIIVSAIQTIINHQ